MKVFFIVNRCNKDSAVTSKVHEPISARIIETSPTVSRQNLKGLVNKSERSLKTHNLGVKKRYRTINKNIQKDYNKFNKKLIWNTQTNNTFTVFQQNICGLINKKEELLHSLPRNSPQITLACK
jgi:hypothetical protein